MELIQEALYCVEPIQQSQLSTECICSEDEGFLLYPVVKNSDIDVPLVAVVPVQNSICDRILDQAFRICSFAANRWPSGSFSNLAMT